MLSFVIEKLISLMGPIATLSKDKRELKDNALRAISIALQETGPGTWLCTKNGY